MPSAVLETGEAALDLPGGAGDRAGLGDDLEFGFLFAPGEVG